MTQSALINLHPDENTQWLRDYPFAINFDRYVGSCNTLDVLSNRVCVPTETENFNLLFFKYDNRNKRIKNINKTYIMQMKFDCRKCNPN